MSIETYDEAPAPVGHSGAAIQIEERPAAAYSGWLAVAAIVVCVVVAIAVVGRPPVGAAVGVLLLVVAGLLLISLVVMQPGQSRGVQFVGQCVGTVRRPGLTAVMPLTVRRGVSVRVR